MHARYALAKADASPKSRSLPADRGQAGLVLSSLPFDPGIAGRVYDALREAILATDIYRADVDGRLDERRLAESLGVSRTPVREALARLEQEGLVRIVPRRGASIVRKSKSEIVEMITVWAAHESMAARLITLRASDDEIATLRELFATFEEGKVRSRLDEYSLVNLRFHQRVIELSHSPLLQSMAAQLLIHIRAIRSRTIGDDGRADRSIVDHIDIIDALERRDAELAERLVRDHALNLAEHVRCTVSESDFAPEDEPSRAR